MINFLSVSCRSSGPDFFPNAAMAILFFENLDNVFRFDPDGVGFAKGKNDMKISWRAKLSWVIERVLRAVRQANRKWSKRPTLYEIFYLTELHCGEFTLLAQRRH